MLGMLGKLGMLGRSRAYTEAEEVREHSAVRLLSVGLLCVWVMMRV